MKFTRIEVENIFAYSGLSHIDLSKTTDERNIIVVRGRNGAGKTSLLNAIKLLFLGAGNPSLRRVGWGNLEMQKNGYVLGVPGRWYGVFNTGAKSSGAPARVALDWTDGGRSYRMQRVFRRVGASFTEDLSINVNGTPLGDAERDATLTQLLPPELVPFFVFDGEQIQSIADADVGREQAEIERLLGLAFIVQLNREIDSYSKDKRRGDLPSDVQLAITLAENKQREAAAQLEAAGRQRVAVEEENLELERDKQRLDAERNRLRTGISEQDRRRMQGRIAVLASQREVLAADIAEKVPAEAIWHTQPELIRDAFRIVEAQTGAIGDASVAQRLFDSLPAAVEAALADLDPAVALSSSQRASLTEALHAFLEEEGVGRTPPGHPLLASMPPKTLRELRDRFLVWSEQGRIVVGRHVEMLVQMRQLGVEYVQAVRDLDEAELTTDEARDRFETLTDEIRKIDTTLRENAERIAEYRIAEQRAQRELAAQEDEVKDLEAKHAERTRQNEAYQFSLRVKRALSDYRDQRRAQIKNAVQNALNERVSLLLGPSELIKSVQLDDQFFMSYFDVRGDEVARHSISAGMRQLLAMSLLWALKDQAARPVPVVIDTPLGRIDRNNRSLLLTDYFPKAGNPLLLLPTNSEISDEELDRLQDHIALRYDIDNGTGQDAKITLDTRFRAAS